MNYYYYAFDVPGTEFCVPHMLAASHCTSFVWTEIIFGVVGVENLFDLIIMSASGKSNNRNDGGGGVDGVGSNMASLNYLESKHMNALNARPNALRTKQDIYRIAKRAESESVSGSGR